MGTNYSPFLLFILYASCISVPIGQWFPAEQPEESPGWGWRSALRLYTQPGRAATIEEVPGPSWGGGGGQLEALLSQGAGGGGDREHC